MANVDKLNIDFAENNFLDLFTITKHYVRVLDNLFLFFDSPDSYPIRKHNGVPT